MKTTSSSSSTKTTTSQSNLRRASNSVIIKANNMTKTTTTTITKQVTTAKMTPTPSSVKNLTSRPRLKHSIISFLGILVGAQVVSGSVLVPLNNRRNSALHQQQQQQQQRPINYHDYLSLSSASSTTTLVAAAAATEQQTNETTTITNTPTTTTTPNTNESTSGNDSTSSSVLAATNTNSINGVEGSALNYLARYGYMNPQAASQLGRTSSNLISEESFSSAISDFQRFAGLPTTGLVDNQTLELMQLPRCGNSDKWRPPPLDSSTGAPRVVSGLQQAPSPLGQVRKFGQLERRLTAVQNQTNLSTTNSRAGGPIRLHRQRRYALQGSKWRRQELTYRISQYPSRFNGKRHEVDDQIAKAFGVWSQVAPIDFIVKREGRVHIDIRFASGDHGDGDAFDGPGNTLAHAYFPQYGGDAHFDDQEYWTIDSYAGTNIFQVAAHELGHSLGLGHSNVREALMAPFYQKYKPNFKLHIDDILAIQALYGEKSLSSAGGDLDPFRFGGVSPSTTSSTTTTTTTSTTTTTTTSTTTTTPAPPSSNRNGNRYPIYRGSRTSTSTTLKPLDIGHEGGAANGGENGLDGAGNDPDLSTNGLGGFGGAFSPPTNESPQSSDFPSSGAFPADLCLDSAIDAVTRTEDGNSYVFKGDHYWLLAQDGLAKVGGYPRRISQDWEGLPGNLDAALTWADGKTFFFKGNKYWRFRNRRRDVGYPKLISSGFAGIPDDIDAALVWSGNGRTYFFKGTEYWRFDSKAEPPVSSEYPRSIKVWLGVPSYLNAAFKWENNVTYFFKGQQYYRFNDREFRVETRGRPAFPRATSEWWFGCVSSNLAAQRALPSSAAAGLTSAGLVHLDSSSGSHLSRGLSGANISSQSTSDSAVGGDWSFLAGLEENTRHMGTHISDHNRPPPQTGGSSNLTPTFGPVEGPSLFNSGEGMLSSSAETEHDLVSAVVTVDGPSGVQASSARQPRQHQPHHSNDPTPQAKFEDFGWPMSRPRGGYMGTTLFSQPPNSGDRQQQVSNSSSASLVATTTTNQHLLIISTAILMASRFLLLTNRSTFNIV